VSVVPDLVRRQALCAFVETLRYVANAVVLVNAQIEVYPDAILSIATGVPGVMVPAGMPPLAPNITGSIPPIIR
jgi:hypothetical protein